MVAELLLRLLLRAELAGAGAVLAVLILRAPVRRLFGSDVAYRLWVLPPLAALAAIFPTPFAVIEGEPLPAYALPGHGLSARMDAAEAALGLTGLAGAVLLVWLAGIAVFAAALALKQARFLRQVRARRAGPAVVGLFWPKVVTPAGHAERFTPEELRLIEAHERTHIERGDPAANLLIAAAAAVSWFNPLAHLGAACARADQEMACDETVLLRLPGARRRYAETLVKAQGAALAPLGCNFPAHPLLARVGAVSRGETPLWRGRVGAACVLFLAVAAVTGGWLTQPAWVAHQPKPPMVYPHDVLLMQILRIAPAGPAARGHVDRASAARPRPPSGAWRRAGEASS